jgi:uncharacterized protein
VINERVLVDTGPLVAILRKNDAHHAVCAEQAKNLTHTMVTCWPVLVEAAWLLGQARVLMRMIASGKLICLDLDQSSFAWIDSYSERYADLKPQLADMALVYLAEREGISRIFTLDRRDFAVYRTSAGKALELLPALL